jgi:hypothetical protein
MSSLGLGSSGVSKPSTATMTFYGTNCQNLTNVAEIADRETEMKDRDGRFSLLINFDKKVVTKKDAAKITE